jgi:hypothetical protein
MNTLKGIGVVLAGIALVGFISGIVLLVQRLPPWTGIYAGIAAIVALIVLSGWMIGQTLD